MVITGLTPITILVFAGLLSVSITASRCKNGDIKGETSYPRCDCNPGFKGYDCSQKIRPCEVSPCRNKASCTNNQDGTFNCSCKTGFKGVLCENEVLACDSGPCKHGGTCVNDKRNKCFQCICPPGRKGQDCSQVVKPCEIKPCKNNGVCVNKKQKFICKCKNGFTGTFCEIKDALYTSTIINKNKTQIAQLEKWLDGAKLWRLCYRASKDGWLSAHFHARCDYKHPTLTLIRSKSYIFGAYSDVIFGGTSGYRSSSNAFIFSLVNKDNLPPFKSQAYQNTGYAIYSHSSYGPSFGYQDILIANNAIENANSVTNFGYTYQPPNGYAYNTIKTKNLLAGSYKFTPNEIETFYIP